MKMLRAKSQSGSIHYCQKPVEGCECEHCNEARRDNSGRVEGTETRIFGEPKKDKNKNGKGKNDFTKAGEMILDGANSEEIMMLMPGTYMRYHGGIDKMVNMMKIQKAKNRNRPPEIIIFYGDTGTGKTTLAMRNWPEAYKVMWPYRDKKQGYGRWYWQNYNFEETVRCDDFKNSIPYNQILDFLDQDPMKIDVKFGGTILTSDRIVFTTTIPPQYWYAWKSDYDRRELSRRIEQFATIYEFTEAYNYDPETSPVYREVHYGEHTEYTRQWFDQYTNSRQNWNFRANGD